MSLDRILIVRLGALGDIVHALPVAAALREAHPEARLDWLVEERHRALLDLVPIVDERIAIAPGCRRHGTLASMIRLRRARYDVAIDVQGLLKSAMLARASGAKRVVGFSAGYLRETAARFFYTETHEPPAHAHVIDQNLALARACGATSPARPFPLAAVRSPATALVRPAAGVDRENRFVLLNPGAGWPNKQWPAGRFGALASYLRHGHEVTSLVVWGPGEEAVAREVVAASGGAARLCPPTSVVDLVALLRGATLMVAGDTGPLHLAVALGTPVVCIQGPTSPARNGPWLWTDASVSRFDGCECHYRRRCHAARWCLDEVSVGQVASAVERRLASASLHA